MAFRGRQARGHPASAAAFADPLLPGSQRPGRRSAGARRAGGRQALASASGSRRGRPFRGHRLTAHCSGRSACRSPARRSNTLRDHQSPVRSQTNTRLPARRRPEQRTEQGILTHVRRLVLLPDRSRRTAAADHDAADGESPRPGIASDIRGLPEPVAGRDRATGDARAASKPVAVVRFTALSATRIHDGPTFDSFRSLVHRCGQTTAAFRRRPVRARSRRNRGRPVELGHRLARAETRTVQMRVEPAQRGLRKDAAAIRPRLRSS